MKSLRKTLEDLGTTPWEVADTLQAAGCRGTRKDPCRCPIAVYLEAAGYMDPKVYLAFVKTGRARVVTPVPNAVADFVAAFDRGRYPDLEAT